MEGFYIFLLRAVMSREALTMRSRRSWWSSSSAQKNSNCGMQDGADGVGSARTSSSRERFTPAILCEDCGLTSAPWTGLQIEMLSIEAQIHCRSPMQ